MGATVKVNHFIIWHRLEAPEVGVRGDRQMLSARAKVAVKDRDKGRSPAGLALTCRLSPAAHNEKHQFSSEGSGGMKRRGPW